MIKSIIMATLAVLMSQSAEPVSALISAAVEEVEESPYFNANLTCQTDTIFKVYNDATCTEFNDTLT